MQQPRLYGVVMMDYIKPADPVVKNIRLQKKIDKLIQQREHLKEQLDHYRAVLQELPGFERKYQGLLAERKRAEDVRNMEIQIKQQQLLIRMLTGDKIDASLIMAEHSKLIKEEYAKLQRK